MLLNGQKKTSVALSQQRLIQSQMLIEAELISDVLEGMEDTKETAGLTHIGTERQVQVKWGPSAEKGGGHDPLIPNPDRIPN